MDDCVALSNGTTEALTSVRECPIHVDVFEIKFAPDETVAAFETSPSTILSMDIGYKCTRREPGVYGRIFVLLVAGMP